jgi:hypothetical protein
MTYPYPKYFAELLGAKVLFVDHDFHSHELGKTKGKGHLDDVLNEHITSL